MVYIPKSWKHHINISTRAVVAVGYTYIYDPACSFSHGMCAQHTTICVHIIVKLQPTINITPPGRILNPNYCINMNGLP